MHDAFIVIENRNIYSCKYRIIRSKVMVDTIPINLSG